MGRPRKDDSRDTRRDILDRALELFANHGFSGSSMRDIARAVGVRESALYHHFPNKHAILSSVLAESGPGAVNSLATGDVIHFIETVGVEKSLMTMSEALVTLWSTHRERLVLRLLMAEWPRLKEANLIDPPRLLAEIRGRLAEVCSLLTKKGLIRPVDPVTTATRFMGPLMLLRLLHLADLAQRPNVVGMREDLSRHVATFWESIRPQASRKKIERRR